MRDNNPKPYLRERAGALLKSADGRAAHWVACEGLLRPRQPDTVYGWLDRYEAQGSPGCTSGAGAAASRPTNLSQASAAQAEVQQVLAQSPRTFGLARTRWRSPDPFFRLKVNRMMQAFTAALSRPTPSAILFQDELSYYRRPTATQMWWLCGDSQPRIEYAPGENHLTRIGAVLDGVSGQVLYQQGEKFGKAAMKQLYHQIRHHYDQPHLFVVQDNYPFHKLPDVLAVAQSLHIRPLFLPTYASGLNPIEKLWRWLKQAVLHAHPFATDLAALRHHVAAFLDRFAAPSDSLLHYVSLLPD